MLVATTLVLSFIPQIFGQSLTIVTPSQVVQCVPVVLAWSGGVSPYHLSIFSGEKLSDLPVRSFPTHQSTTLLWTVDLSANVQFTLSIRDSAGGQANSSAVTVQSGPDSSCLADPLFTSQQDQGISYSPTSSIPASTPTGSVASNNSPKKNRMVIIIAAAVACGLLFVTIGFLAIFWRRRSRSRESHMIQNVRYDGAGPPPLETVFPYTLKSPDQPADNQLGHTQLPVPPTSAGLAYSAHSSSEKLIQSLDNQSSHGHGYGGRASSISSHNSPFNPDTQSLHCYPPPMPTSPSPLHTLPPGLHSGPSYSEFSSLQSHNNGSSSSSPPLATTVRHHHNFPQDSKAAMRQAELQNQIETTQTEVGDMQSGGSTLRRSSSHHGDETGDLIHQMELMKAEIERLKVQQRPPPPIADWEMDAAPPGYAA